MKKSILKKMMTVLLACVMTCSLMAGCGDKKEEQTNVNMPNPMTEISADQLAIPMNLPEGATDVKYFMLDDGSDTPVYQMDFTYDGHAYTYRAQSTMGMDAYDMSGLNYQDWNSDPADIGYCGGIVQTNSEAAAVYWLDVVPGINYTLGCSDSVPADEIVSMANEVFVSAQGDSDADEEMDFIPLSAPMNAENSVYSSEDNMSTLEFDYGDVHFVYQAAYTSELKAFDMSGVEGSNWKSGNVQVAYCDAFAKDCDTASVLYWLDIVPGVNYTLSCNADLAIEEMLRIANEIFIPTQGEVDGDYSIPLTAPENAENTDFYTDNDVSTLEFDYGDVHFVYQAAYTSELKAFDMSGVEGSNWKSGKVEVAYCDAFAKDCDTASVLYWLDIVPGVNYTLSCDADLAIEEMLEVANEIFVPMQGEVG